MDGRCRCEAWHLDTTACDQATRPGNGISGSLCHPCFGLARGDGLRLDNRFVLLLGRDGREMPPEFSKTVLRRGSFNSNVGWKTWHGIRLVTAYVATGGRASLARQLKEDMKLTTCVVILEKTAEESEVLRQYASSFERFQDNIDLRLFTNATAKGALFLDVRSRMRSSPRSPSKQPPPLEQSTLPFLHHPPARHATIGAGSPTDNVSAEASPCIDAFLRDVIRSPQGLATPSRGDRADCHVHCGSARKRPRSPPTPGSVRQ